LSCPGFVVSRVCPVQGLSVQGLSVQGLSVQGLSVQGLSVQGLSVKGLSVYPGILVSGAPTLRRMFGIGSANGCSNCTVLDATAQHRIPIDSFIWRIGFQ
jgi:hypothetical protein